MRRVADVTVVVGTYGDQKWIDLADNAVRSVDRQTMSARGLIRQHADGLAEARNKAANKAFTKWLIFLDADDTLDPGYIEAMMEPLDDSTLRQPATLGVYPDGTEDDEAVLIPKRSLLESNYLVIGTMCLREQFLDVGGFDAGLPVLEDWDLWLRMWRNGDTIGHRPKAVYRVGVNPGSRNQDQGVHNRYYNQIRRRYV